MVTSACDVASTKPEPPLTVTDTLTWCVFPPPVAVSVAALVAQVAPDALTTNEPLVSVAERTTELALSPLASPSSVTVTGAVKPACRATEKVKTLELLGDSAAKLPALKLKSGSALGWG
jgi:hypothetical protein